MRIKRLLSVVLVLIFSLTLCCSYMTTVSSAEGFVNQSKMLKVTGNRITLAEDESTEVILSGVNIPGGEWTGTPGAEKWERSIYEAMNNWDCNLIRLAVGTKGWNAEYSYQGGNPTSYRNYVKSIIDIASRAGKYVILDLHEYGIFDAKDLQFWREASQIYGNNPTVLFGVLNEPTPPNWEVWANGDPNVKIGHQQIVEAIRDAGAKNIIVAGGRSYAAEFSGITGDSDDHIVRALKDQGSNGNLSKTGNGIVYDMHQYAWHGIESSWDSRAGAVRTKYPMLMGEFGWDANLNLELGRKVFNEGDEQYHTKWFNHLLPWLDNTEQYGNHMAFTAYSFHPSSAPAMLKPHDNSGINWGNENYTYTPTDYHGVYIKWMLEERFKKNLITEKEIFDSSSGRPTTTTSPSLAIDGDDTTSWDCGRSSDGYISFDLGEKYKITRYVVKHGGYNSNADNIKNFRLQVSDDGENWRDVDSVTDNEFIITDRWVGNAYGRYVRFCADEIDGTSSLIRVYDIGIYGEVSDGLSYKMIDPPAYIPDVQSSETTVSKLQQLIFPDGSTVDDWSHKNKISYPTDPETNKRVLAVTELNGTQCIGLSGGSTFGSFANVNEFRYKYKSTKDVEYQMELEYRSSNGSTESKKYTTAINFPSTNGEWTEKVIPIRDLMPTPSDTWVLTSMATAWRNNFYPIVKINLSGNFDGSDYIYFEHFKALWYGTASYMMDYLSMAGGLSESVTKLEMKWKSTYGEINGLQNVLALYDDNDNLVDVTMCQTDIENGSYTQKQTMRMSTPANVNEGYYLKLFTFRNGDTIEPVCETLTISYDGSINYGGY